MSISNAFQEEDFVTQLYNRSLLTPFDVGHFQKLIDEAVAWIDREANLDEKLRDAIRCRLRFRRDFLAAVEQDIGIIETRSSEHFVSCLKLLPTLKESFDVGKPVPEAFSLKIQRKLASTLPPRPMVNVSPEDAMEHLTRLCEDAIDLNEIIDYRGPYNLKVGSFPRGLNLSNCTGRCLDFIIPETTRLRLYTITCPVDRSGRPYHTRMRAPEAVFVQ